MWVDSRLFEKMSIVNPVIRDPHHKITHIPRDFIILFDERRAVARDDPPGIFRLSAT
jgi:hypothetical protein